MTTKTKAKTISNSKAIATVKAKPAPKTAGRLPTYEEAFEAGWMIKDAHHEEQLLAGIDTAGALIAATREEMLTVVGHPMFAVLCAAIHQAAFGKGGRHGGNVTPFLSQPWAHYARMHGRGFLTGQATKKLEEAAHQRDGEAYIHEATGAIVYAAMSILHEQGATKVDPA